MRRCTLTTSGPVHALGHGQMVILSAGAGRDRSDSSAGIGEVGLTAGRSGSYPATAIPIMGAFRCWPPMEPRNVAFP
jgi:hypothetical protein